MLDAFVLLGLADGIGMLDLFEVLDVSKRFSLLGEGVLVLMLDLFEALDDIKRSV